MRAVFLPLLFFPLLHFSPPYYPGSLRSLSFFVPLQVSNHRYLSRTSRLGDGLLLSLTSLSSTPLQYVIQLRITSGQFVFILLDSFKCIKIFITIYAFICLMHVSRYTKTCIACLFILGSQVNKRGNDLILSLCMVYLLSRPTLENGRYIE